MTPVTYSESLYQWQTDKFRMFLMWAMVPMESAHFKGVSTFLELILIQLTLTTNLQFL